MSVGTQGEFFDKPEVVTPVNEDLNAVSPTPKDTKKGLKDLSIPKLYYSISEVSRLTGVEQYILRYWEAEFDDLRPQKNRAGNRTYLNKDIKFILKVKDLLREKRYTIDGAKHILKEERQAEKERASEEPEIKDPAQIALNSDAKKVEKAVPSAMLTLAEIQNMKASLLELKTALTRVR